MRQVEYKQHEIPCIGVSIQVQDEIGDGHSRGKSPCFNSHADCAMNHLIRLVAEYIFWATAKELMGNLHQYLEHRMRVKRTHLDNNSCGNHYITCHACRQPQLQEITSHCYSKMEWKQTCSNWFVQLCSWCGRVIRKVAWLIEVE